MQAEEISQIPQETELGEIPNSEITLAEDQISTHLEIPESNASQIMIADSQLDLRTDQESVDMGIEVSESKSIPDLNDLEIPARQKIEDFNQLENEGNHQAADDDIEVTSIKSTPSNKANSIIEKSGLDVPHSQIMGSISRIDSATPSEHTVSNMSMDNVSMQASQMEINASCLNVDEIRATEPAHLPTEENFPQNDQNLNQMDPSEQIVAEVIESASKEFSDELNELESRDQEIGSVHEVADSDLDTAEDIPPSTLAHHDNLSIDPSIRSNISINEPSQSQSVQKEGAEEENQSEPLEHEDPEASSYTQAENIEMDQSQSEIVSNYTMAEQVEMADSEIVSNYSYQKSLAPQDVALLESQSNLHFETNDELGSVVELGGSWNFLCQDFASYRKANLSDTKIPIRLFFWDYLNSTTYTWTLSTRLNQ